MSGECSPGYQISNAVAACNFPEFRELCNKFPEVATEFARQGSEISFKNGGSERGFWNYSFYASPPLLLVARASAEHPDKGGEAWEIFQILLVLGANEDYLDYYGNTLESWFVNPDKKKCVPSCLREKIEEFLAAEDKKTYISEVRARLDFKL